MKKAEIIKNKFSFLISFSISFTFKNPGYECLIKWENVQICISESEDYRDENRIDFIIKKGTKILFSFYYEPMVNSNLIGVDELALNINAEYDMAKNKRKGFTINNFEKTIKSFAHFVEINMNSLEDIKV